MTPNDRDAKVVDDLRLQLRIDPDHTSKMKARTFWTVKFGIKSRKASRVETIRQLLCGRGIVVTSGFDFGKEPDAAFVTLTLADAMPMPSAEWFQRMMTRTLVNEVEVEYWFVLRLLDALGYHEDDIALQHRVPMSAGSKPLRNTRADVVVFDGHDRKRPMFVVEVKDLAHELSEPSATQAQSYAFALQCPAWMVTNANQTELYVHGTGNRHRLILSFRRSELQDRWLDLIRHLSRESMVDSCSQLHVVSD